MLKLSIPTEDGFYTPLIEHPRVLRVVALSGGYSRDEANERLARNPGLIASFSRALLGELSADQSDEEFNTTLQTGDRHHSRGIDHRLLDAGSKSRCRGYAGLPAADDSPMPRGRG
jgi:hypothetical protein